MKLTKDLETEIKQMMDDYWDSYLKGDLKTWSSYLPDNYRNIGTTQEEIWSSKQDIVDYSNKVINQLMGMADLRNKQVHIIPFDPHIMVHELGDMYIKMEGGWNFYAKLRLSSLLEKTEAGWKILHQHGSYPDSKAEEGETFAFDKISQENLELREAIKRRTVELEQKNRELEIEGALERIRAQAVAMKESSDLLDIVVTMRNEFTRLGHEAHYFWHMMWLQDKYEKAMTSGDGSRIGMVMELPRDFHTKYQDTVAWENSNEPIHILAMDAETAVDYVDRMITQGNFQQVDPNAPSLDDVQHIGGLTFVMARTTHGEIGYSLPGVVKNPPAEDLEILERFAGAFDLAHRRFLDLQKAEAQAREVEIELALEKVRSRTMAMQHSSELAEASFLLDQQVRGLGIKTWGCAFNIYGERDSTEWFGNGAGILPTYTVPRVGIFKQYYQRGQKGESFFIKEIEGEECITHYEFMSTLPVVGDVLKQLKKTNGSFPTYQIDHVVYFKYGYLLFITRESVPEAHHIFKRFAKVFEQTYTRFLDLQKAEAQAREAQIEAALERVRSRSLAMHNSEELQEVVNTVAQELQNINIDINGGVFITINDEISRDAVIWGCGGAANYVQKAVIPFLDRPIFTRLLDAIRKREDFLVEEYTREEKIEFFEHLFKHPPWNSTHRQRKKQLLSLEGGYTRSVTVSANTSIFIINNTGKLFSDEDNDILKRFGKVFEQSYTRFLDLQKAEAQAREATKQASLDRVRGQIASMRSTEDLQRITPLVFNELTTLGVPFIRCGVFIIDEADRNVQAYLSAPDGHSLGVLNLPYHSNELIDKIVASWRKNLVYKEHWTREDFVQWTESMMEMGQVSDKKTYQGGDAPPQSLDLHFIPFKQGMLYVGNNEPLAEAEIDVSRSLADAFSIAYARYQDFTKLDAAKQKVEAAFADLEAAQDQLVQQEKLASLGQLTAGIAHEIKNPLNFVNNFSEVSIELIEEAKQEVREELRNQESEFRTQESLSAEGTPLEEGGKDGGVVKGDNSGYILEILNDIEANLRKIHEHGHRADRIVKSMLQHSRKGSGINEPVNLNALVREFVNLAFHGMRASTHPINVDIQFNLDKAIKEVPLIAEDFSRVIVNLCNNAFDAMKEKLSSRQQSGDQPSASYAPKLTVKTTSGNDQVIVEIEDNGPGIPMEIRDKIMQPFFTTKKGTEGTGLGLSITNDIIKAHGGDIMVSSEETKGSVFKIQLPV